MNRKIILTSLLLMFGSAWATIPANVDRTQIEEGQSFTLTITLPNSSDNPDLSILNKNFEILGTSSSSQTSIINGKVSSQNTLTISLMPKNAGSLMIPPIKVGNDLTNVINISVSSSASNGAAGKNNRSVYADTNLPKQNIYSGVPFIYTIRLHFNVGLSNVGLEPINIDHAQIQLQGKPTQYRATENGRPYEVAEQKFIITPNKAGQLVIPAIKLKGTINAGNSIIPGIINGQPFVAQTKPQTIQVKAIPSSVPADEWLPAKKLTVSDSWSTNDTTIKIGDPVTRSISLEALGIPASTIPELKLITPTGVNAYPDKSQSTSNDQGADMVSTKTFKTAYIATKSGTIKFPEIHIKWWDITTDSPKTAVIPAKEFTVTNDSSNLVINSSQPAGIIKQASSDASSQNVAGGESKDRLWQYISGVLAGLWLLTMFFVIKFLRRKKSRKEESTPIKNNDNNTPQQEYMRLENTQAMNIKEACKQRNVMALNKAICQWAKDHGLEKVYTIADVKKLSQNAELKVLIDQLTAAQYNNHEFTNYEDVATIIKTIEQQLKQNKGTPLREFYSK